MNQSTNVYKVSSIDISNIETVSDPWNPKWEIEILKSAILWGPKAIE